MKTAPNARITGISVQVFWLVLFSAITISCSTTASPDVSSPTHTKVPATIAYIPTKVPTEPSAMTPEDTLPPAVETLRQSLESRGLQTRLLMISADRIDFSHDPERGDLVKMGTFLRQGDREHIFEVRKASGNTLTFGLDSLGVDEDGRFIVRNENGQVQFVYYPELLRMVQTRESSFLSVYAGNLTLNIGDGWEMNNYLVVDDFSINESVHSQTFNLGQFGIFADLTASDRLHLATDLAQVVSARAWDPEYTFDDLRAGKVYSLSGLEGGLYLVNPANGISFNLVTIAPPGETFSWQSGGLAGRFWWEISSSGALSVFASESPSSQYLKDITGRIASIHPELNLYDSLLIMVLWQYLESGHSEPLGPNRIPWRHLGAEHILPELPIDDYFVRLIFQVDPTKSRIDPQCRCDLGEVRRILWDETLLRHTAIPVGSP